MKPLSLQHFFVAFLLVFALFSLSNPLSAQSSEGTLLELEADNNPNGDFDEQDETTGDEQQKELLNTFSFSILPLLSAQKPLTQPSNTKTLTQHQPDLRPPISL